MDTSTQPLTPTQLTILKIIYKFRFVTAGLVSSYRSTNKNASYELLSMLYKNGYIGRRYDSSYKLQGKSARYYLASKSLKLLKQEEGVNERVLHARYKDKHSTESFVLGALEAFKTALEIRSAYPDTFMIFSQYELANYSQFPRPLPTFYLKRNAHSPDKPNEYFIELLGDSQFFVVKKLIDRYVEQYEEGEWQGGIYPNVLLQTSNTNLRKRVAEYIDSLIENGYIDEDELMVQAISTIATL